ncbi:MAG: hypothetical protein AB1765_00765 [Candidatus Hydrogenedentota bacterium]
MAIDKKKFSVVVHSDAVELKIFKPQPGRSISIGNIFITRGDDAPKVNQILGMFDDKNGELKNVTRKSNLSKNQLEIKNDEDDPDYLSLKIKMDKNSATFINTLTITRYFNGMLEVGKPFEFDSGISPAKDKDATSTDNELPTFEKITTDLDFDTDNFLKA